MVVITGWPALRCARRTRVWSAPADAASVEGLIDVATGIRPWRGGRRRRRYRRRLILGTVGAGGWSRAYAGAAARCRCRCGRACPRPVSSSTARRISAGCAREAQRASAGRLAAPDLREVRRALCRSRRLALGVRSWSGSLTWSPVENRRLRRAPGRVERIERDRPQPGEGMRCQAPRRDCSGIAEQLAPGRVRGRAHLLGDDASGPEAPGAAELLAAAARRSAPGIDHDCALADLHVRLQEVHPARGSWIQVTLSAYADGARCR